MAGFQSGVNAVVASLVCSAQIFVPEALQRIFNVVKPAARIAVSSPPRPAEGA
jgi:hypothetical protein